MSCMVAGAITNPMDVVKIRMQLQRALLDEAQVSTLTYRTFRQSALKILTEEGLRGLIWPGMTASVLRELSYSSIRFGLYGPVKRAVGTVLGSQPGGDVGLAVKFASGMTTGAVGSCLANPLDLIKIRLQAEAGRVVNGVYTSGLRAGHRPTYSGTFSALTTIPRAEGGLSALYTGVLATAARASLLTAGQLASYDHTKYLLKSKYALLTDGWTLHVLASVVAGLCASTVAAPADLVKSRIMGDPEHRHYKGVADCIVKTVREEGVRALFKGWVPSYLRIAPHFVISLPLFEQFRMWLGVEMV
ncbi:mitochondrial substrate carrier family protein ucpB-like protein [Catenaria anguillulae PL171]|uniref:Mitochondrial substrate carrier family protein ucpB-like protein n=1 Tax=Catenaria anguillulae PL171 TaxID=765915 RepID=A0A1Y2HCU1_9FUNG|nr:mitochondrial substrate carrier family protein ucpB-like protein [Catenaria anguillulae PL171]